jgi:hypothetical protein
MKAVSLEGGFESGPTAPNYDPTSDVLDIWLLNRPKQLHSDFMRLVAARDAGLRPSRLTEAALYLGDIAGQDVLSAEVYDYQDSITIARNDGIVYFENDETSVAGEDSSHTYILPDFLFDGTKDGLGPNPIGPGDVYAVTIRRRTLIDPSRWTRKDALSVYFTTDLGGLFQTDAMGFLVEAPLLIPGRPTYKNGAAYTKWFDDGAMRKVRPPDSEETQVVVDKLLERISWVADKVYKP